MKYVLTRKQIQFLIENDEGKQSVEDIQKKLKEKGYYLGKYGPNKDGVDGVMGPLTKKAYKEEYGVDFESDGEDGVEEIEDSDLKPYNFHKIPSGTNNYRSAEPPLKYLKKIINKYGIKNIIRLNGEGSDSNGLSISDEKGICEENDCKFHKLSATRDQDKVNELLSNGNTLIHCHHGADRTGGNVGGWLYKQGWGDTKKIWDYTTKYNGWERMVLNKPDTFVNGGYLKQAQKFGVKDLEHAKSLSSN